MRPALAAPVRADYLDPSAFASLGTLNLTAGNYTIDTNGAPTLRDSSNNTYYVKWLDREVRFNKVANSFCSPLVAELGSLSNLPSLSNLNDPSNSTDSTYIGAKPTLTSAPRVLDGVVQRAAQ